jgi:hypothetical protein
MEDCEFKKPWEFSHNDWEMLVTALQVKNNKLLWKGWGEMCVNEIMQRNDCNKNIYVMVASRGEWGETKAACGTAPIWVADGCGVINAELCEELLDCDVSEWEREFLESILSRKKLTFSEKQEAVIGRMASRHLNKRLSD